jgi:hypothetical protein
VSLDPLDGERRMSGPVGAAEEDEDEDDDLDDDDEDEDEDDDEDDEDEDDEDDDEEDEDVATDERGNETLKSAGGVAEDDVDHQPANVRSDRVPATDAEPEGSLDKVKTAPLGIQEIENIEEDSKGG